jgi:ABC-type transport system substrate-binding protein
MKNKPTWLPLFSALMVVVFILAACQPTTVPTPERIVETVVVTQMVEGTPVQVVVTPTPGAEEEAPVPDTGHQIIPAESLVACQPFPEGVEIEAGNGGSARRGKLDTASQASPAERAANQSYFGSLNTSSARQGEKIYRVGVFSDVTSLNFFQANGPDNTVWNAYMLPPRMTLYGLTEKYFTFVPGVAVPAQPDPLVQEGEFWVTTIPIHQDILWSDGQPLTAKDFAFTANTAVKFGLFAGNWGAWYDGNFLDHVEAVDDYTVKIYYHTRPGMARHEYGVLQAPILPEHFWAPLVTEAAKPIDALAADASQEDRAAAQAEATEALFAIVPDGEPTAGAFQLSKWEPGAFMDETANPDYFQKGLTITNYGNGAYEDSEGVKAGEPEGDPETTIQVGPHVDAVIYTIYGSQNAAILALKNGEIDFVLNPLGLQRGLVSQIEGDPNLSVLENPVNGFRYLSFNNRRQPMNNCAFRQAVAFLIDKEFVTQTILQGVAFPYYTYVAEGNAKWFSDEAPKLGRGLSREQRVNAAISTLEQAGFSWEGGTKPSFDAENNSVVAGGRLLMPDGTPVPELDLWAPNAGYDPLRSTFAIWIETWLNELGIPVKAQLAGFNELITRIYTDQDFDMYILGLSLGIFPTVLRDYFSEEQSAPGGNNAGGYINAEFETLSNELLFCPDYETCKPIADRIQMMLSTETPYVVLFDTGIIEAYRSASIQFPFTEQLSGLQYTHQGPWSVLQAEVNVK